MTTGVIIQARMGASRLPNKVALELNGKTVLEQVIHRVKRCERIDIIIVATTENIADDKVAEIAKRNSISVFRGSESDVLSRYYYAAKEYKLDNIVRITADCPLIDAEVIDQVIHVFSEQSADYASNTMEPTYPDGLDCEIMTFSALEKAFLEAKLKYEREHVTQFIIRRPELFKIVSIQNDTDYSNKRWTLDEPEDFEFIKAVYQGMKAKEHFGFPDILNFLKKNPKVEEINKEFLRNEGLLKSISEENIDG